MKDIQIVPMKTVLVQPMLLGKTTTASLILYQKVLILMLSSSKQFCRESAGTSLIDLLQGANIPADQLLTTLGSAACAKVLSLLQDTDRQLVSSLTAEAANGTLSITLQLKTGQSYTGVLT